MAVKILNKEELIEMLDKSTSSDTKQTFLKSINSNKNLKDDKDVILAALTHGGGYYQFAGKKLKKNKEVALAVLDDCFFMRDSYGSLPEDEWDYKKASSYILTQIDISLWSDIDVCKAACKAYPDLAITENFVEFRGKNLIKILDMKITDKQEALNFSNPSQTEKEYKERLAKKKLLEMFADFATLETKEIFINVIKANPELQNDREVMLSAIDFDGLLYEYIGNELTKDKLIALNALKERLGEREDYGFILEDEWSHEKACSYILNRMDKSLWKDKEIRTTACLAYAEIMFRKEAVFYRRKSIYNKK